MTRTTRRTPRGWISAMLAGAALSLTAAPAQAQDEATPEPVRLTRADREALRDAREAELRETLGLADDEALSLIRSCAAEQPFPIPWNDADILPGDAADGESAASMQTQFGIGPGCTGELQPDGSTTGQAIPPVRIREVCESLDEGDRVRCCIESICGDDFSPAIGCLTDIIQEAIDPIG